MNAAADCLKNPPFEQIPASLPPPAKLELRGRTRRREQPVQIYNPIPDILANHPKKKENVSL